MRYEELDQFINQGRSPREGRTLANNTRAERRDRGEIAIRYHQTDILTFSPEGWVRYETGGWHTSTTKDRFNRFGVEGVHIWQTNHVWFVGIRGRTNPGSQTIWEGNPLRYFDGMTFTPRDEYGNPPDVLFPEDGPNFEKLDRFNKEMTKRIAEYVRGYTPEEISRLVETLRNGESRGDCLYCQLAMPGGDHLTLHLEENYRMGSLLLKAYRHKGYGDPGLVLLMDSNSNYGNGKNARKILSQYLKGELLKTDPAQLEEEDATS